MHAAVEHGPVLCSDSNILCLSWKGRVPKSEKEKPVCRRRYYEEGWLATGNGRGVVGVTFTSSHCKRDRNTPQRTNFNLRGHNSEVVLVRWNEPFQKLATCDADGGIFVWIQYEGRWSVELVNDRGAQVSDFTWSHDGTQALISYRDGFVLVGSVSGQRHWSSEINLDSQITCGIWTPDDQQVLFGTADGQVIVMDCHGRMLAHVLLHESDGILSMSWNYPSFLVEDSSESDTDSDDYSPPQDGPSAYPIPVQNIKPLLTVGFTSGDISLMNNYDDLSPSIIRSGLKDVVVQWCTQGDLLAVAGMEKQSPPLAELSGGLLLKSALIKFYNVRGEHIYTLETPVQRPITSICWGHRDSRLFLASGPALYVVRVEHRISNLQLLCQQAIASCLREDKDIGKLILPPRLCSYLTTAFISTIKPPIPDPNNMRDFVSYPTAGNERLHCTMKRTEDDPEVGGPCYTLYLEYLGGLVPILKGRRISKLRPEFVIMDPKTDGKTDEIYGNGLISTVIDSCNCSDSSDIELSDDWAAKKSPKISRASKSPKLPRINIEARKSPKLSRAAQEISRSPRLPIRKSSIGSPSLNRREFPLEDITQHNYLAQVTSNIWGTKFKIVGLAAFLPANLGAVIYKTSLLHLQPRQMTIYLPEVRKISMDYINLPVFNPNVFSEDEDDLPVSGASGIPENNPPCTVNIPIAPIHSSAQAMSPTQSIGLVQSLLANQNVQLDVLTNQTISSGPPEHAGDANLQYAVPNRYSNPGQVIFGSVEIGRMIQAPHQHPFQAPPQQHVLQAPPQQHPFQLPPQQQNFQAPHQQPPFQMPPQQHPFQLSSHPHSFQAPSHQHSPTVSSQLHPLQMQSQQHPHQALPQQHAHQAPSQLHPLQVPPQQHAHQGPSQQHTHYTPSQQHTHQAPFHHNLQAHTQQQTLQAASHQQHPHPAPPQQHPLHASSHQPHPLQAPSHQPHPLPVLSQQHPIQGPTQQHPLQASSQHHSLQGPPQQQPLQAPTLQHSYQSLPHQHHLQTPPHQHQGAMQMSIADHGERDHEHLQKAKMVRPIQQYAEADALVFSSAPEIQMTKMNPPPPYPGTIPAPPTAAPPPPPILQSTLDLCLKRGDFSVFSPGNYQTPVGYERITTFDSSGNVEEVCRPRTRMLCAQSNNFTLPGPGSSATLRVSATEKKVKQPCTSATLNRLTVPRYSIPSGDPPPYPEIASQLAQGRSVGQRLDSSIIHATLRRNSREAALKMAQLADNQRATLPHPSDSQRPSLPYPSDSQRSTLPHPSDIQRATLPHPLDNQRATLPHPSDSQRATLPHPSDSHRASLPHPSDSQRGTLPYPSDIQRGTLAHPSDSHRATLPHPSDSQRATLPHPSDSHRASFSHPSDSHRATLPHPSDSHRATLPHPSDSQRATLPHPSDNHRATLPHPSDSQRATMQQTSESQRATLQYPSDSQRATLQHPSDIQRSTLHHSSDSQRATMHHPPKLKSNVVTSQYQQRVPSSSFTCSQCSSSNNNSTNTNSSTAVSNIRSDLPSGSVAHHSTVIVHSSSTSPLTSQSSYNLLSPVETCRDRTEYINSAFTEDEALSQHCQMEKALRHTALTEAAMGVKRPPPYQWDPVVSEDIWVPQERTAQTSMPNHHTPPLLTIGQSQHVDMSRVPFVSPKSPTSPLATFQLNYGVNLPYPGNYSTPPLQGMQAPCSPKEASAPAQFAQHESSLVLQPGYQSNLSSCPMPPMYPGSSTCSSLQLPAIALHPWNSFNSCPPMQASTGTLSPKQHSAVEKPVISSPPADPQSRVGTEVMVETSDTFQEVLSLTESPVPQRADKFGKKIRKRLDSRAEEGNVPAIAEGKVKKEARTLSDFNSLISSPRLGREKKKVKSQKDQLKSKKLNKTNEFQDSSESEPELFISGDELMNQNQSNKKGWKTKRNLRTGSELDEFKCRKANEKEDGRFGSQGFVYVMANKQPLWNEATQVYQLDFGGRVTQESAKNFQIELEGRQVMQFGRIDGNAYILDFQYPFSAVQAFAVALANVTQRLK
ncbi:tubby-related protein 4 [Ambystoma mexicanum]|uniref:tubby-related protein 4 n=1 Tax=Ambystoma mexicanum TaxID=8296 RepID=UPI0037E8C201